jgi:hypothetical protein
MADTMEWMRKMVMVKEEEMRVEISPASRMDVSAICTRTPCVILWTHRVEVHVYSRMLP